MSDSGEIRVATGMRRVLIVDDHPIVRQGLTQLIAQEPDLEVCGGAESATEAIQELERKSPDLVIVDISLKDSHGLDLIGRIKTIDNRVKMLVWSMHDEKVYAQRALKEGALGYVNKQEPTDVVIEAIRRVLQDEVFLSAEMTDYLMHHGGRGQASEETSVSLLTNRELQIFELIGKGMTTRQIACQLDVRPKTVEAHRENTKRKLGLNNSAELSRAAVLWVLESG
jgi:DNA-binding NarL/FixJ family response regulator